MYISNLRGGSIFSYIRRMEISVLLAYYDNLNALKLVLEGFRQQSFTNFEVIIAEDDNNPETRQFLKEKLKNYFFPIQHVHMEVKRGFRKSEMLNKAVCASTGETLVLIDGDCIPHKHFLKEHHKNQKNGYFFFGRRVLLGEKITAKILSGKSLSYLSFYSLLFSDSTLKKEGIYWPWFGLYTKNKRKLSGHNWSVQKEDMLKINGFDEDYNRPGVGEDYDVEWRLKAMGLKMKSVKNRAIVYHLFHKRTNSRENVEYVYSLLEQKKQAMQLKCLNGIEKLSNTDK